MANIQVNDIWEDLREFKSRKTTKRTKWVNVVNVERE